MDSWKSTCQNWHIWASAHASAGFQTFRQRNFQSRHIPCLAPRSSNQQNVAIILLVTAGILQGCPVWRDFNWMLDFWHAVTAATAAKPIIAFFLDGPKIVCFVSFHSSSWCVNCGTNHPPGSGAKKNENLEGSEIKFETSAVVTANWLAGRVVHVMSVETT